MESLSEKLGDDITTYALKSKEMKELPLIRRITAGYKEPVAVSSTCDIISQISISDKYTKSKFFEFMEWQFDEKASAQENRLAIDRDTVEAIMKMASKVHNRVAPSSSAAYQVRYFIIRQYLDMVIAGIISC
jgi:hypothetical protein